LQARQAALSTAVSRFLVQNNEAEEQATAEITGIYDRVQRQLYFFLSAALLVIVLTSLYLIRANRIIFAQIEALSEQRSELAQKLISTQESTLRHLSRELHDEFGQVLTAIGALLARAGKQMPGDAALREEWKEAWVRLTYAPQELTLEIEDHGKGVKREKGQHGIGMVAMRERAELIGGTLEYQKPEAGGTRVKLCVAREKVQAHGG